MKKLIALAVAAVMAAGAFSTAAYAFEPNNTECIAPAAPGGGWDFTCRQVGKTLQDLKIIPGTMQVTNIAGGGGGVAFAEVVNKRNSDNDLIVAASSATATRLAQGAFPGNDHGPGAVARLDRRRLRRHRRFQELADQDTARTDGEGEEGSRRPSPSPAVRPWAAGTISRC